MPDMFTQAYALLIGIGHTEYSRWSLPVTVQDMQALYAVLVDPSLCAYPHDETHVRLLKNDGAKRLDILDGLGWLSQKALEDPQSTVTIFYSGHGWLDQSKKKYYLIPHDADPFDLTGTALSGEDFTTALRQIQSQRLLVFIDCCHAGGVTTSKFIPEFKLPTGFEQTALPKSLVHELKQGQGRAVFSSSNGSQVSWVRPQGDLSIYTYHLIEALHGAGSRPGETVVCLSDLMYYLGKAVPKSAQAMGGEQTPYADLAAEDFPVALLRGGKGLPGNPLEAIRKEAEQTVSNLIQADVLVDGEMNTSGDFIGRDQTKVQVSGTGNVAIGGDTIEPVIIIGNRNAVNSKNAPK